MTRIFTFNRLILSIILSTFVFFLKINAQPLPADFPQNVVDKVNNPAPGYYFLANPAKIQEYGNFIWMLDNDGNVVKWKRTNLRGYDFNMKPNGLFSYAEAISAGWFWANVRMYVLDQNLALIDSFECGNGVQADMHEFEWMPNGHVFLLAQDPKYVDMSKIVEGGNPNAQFAGTIIQELDEDRNVVFQWRSWDYLDPKDSYEDLKTAQVNPFHFNAMDFDDDGNILVSVRHTCEIMKINRKTGAIMWRLGGKNNMFTVENEYDPIDGTYFSHQHNIKRLPNGNITLYDNGWIRQPQFSRGLEYQLDEKNLVAKKVWDYRHTPDIYTELMGSVQLLENGNRIICWGGPNIEGRTLMTELHPDNSIALELTVSPKVSSYRIAKHVLPGCQPKAELSKSELMEGNVYTFNKDNVITGVSLSLTNLTGFNYNNVTVSVNPCSPLYPKFEGKAPIVYEGKIDITSSEIETATAEVTFDLAQFPVVLYPEKTIVLKRDTIGKGGFIKLNTVYDAANNKLTATSNMFGEFVFGYVDSTVNELLPPKLIYPIAGIKHNVNKPLKLAWNPTGYHETSEVEIYDAEQSNPVVAFSSIPSIRQIDINNFEIGKKYYWKARSSVEGIVSPWTNLDSFIVAEPYMTMVYPNGGETFTNDSSSIIIRWEKNVDEKAVIELLRADTVAAVIKDSLLSYTGAFRWYITSAVQPDSNYKIRIRNYSENNLTVQSSDVFTIKSATSLEEQPSVITMTVNVMPNPSNDKFNFEFISPEAGMAIITLTDAAGREHTIYNDFLQKGFNQLSFNRNGLNSGIYFYKISIGEVTTNGKLTIVK